MAEFICKHPTYIQRIQPAVNIINANSNPIYRKTLLMDGGSSLVDQSQIETKLNEFIKSNNDIGRTIYETIKTLTTRISSNHQEITSAIDVAQRLFPKLISPKAAAMAKQFDTFIKISTDLLNNCENRDVIGIIQGLCNNGHIVIKFYKTAKS